MFGKHTRPIMNSEIRDKKVRLINQAGKQVGVKNTSDALKKAKNNHLDLILVAPQAHPAVARLVNYDKFRFIQQKHAKAVKKNHKPAKLKQIKVTTVIGSNDLKVKENHAKKFLKKGNKVRVSLWFKGRSITHKSIGYSVLMKFAKSLDKESKLTQKPKLDGRTMFLTLSPK